jgi:hypothetical protein
MTLRANIRRALVTPCRCDILRHFIAPRFVPATTHRRRLGRVLDVLMELRGAPETNASKLAKIFRCTPKSIQRDLDYLRSEGFAIAWDHDKQTYRLEDSDRHPWLTKGLV